jgi:hypothetical protein
MNRTRLLLGSAAVALTATAVAPVSAAEAADPQALATTVQSGGAIAEAEANRRQGLGEAAQLRGDAGGEGRGGVALGVAELVGAAVGHDPGPVVGELGAGDDQVAAGVGAGVAEAVVLRDHIEDGGVAREALADLEARVGAARGVGVVELAAHGVESAEWLMKYVELNNRRIEKTEVFKLLGSNFCLSDAASFVSIDI